MAVGEVRGVSRFEQGGDTRVSSVEAVQRALEGLGLCFFGQGEVSLSGGAGVRFSEGASQ